MAESQSRGTSSVTRDEFENFTAHVEARFTAVAASIDRVADKIDHMNQPRYGMWISAGSLLVAICALGGALVTKTVSSEAALSAARDEHQREMIAVVERGSNRFTRDDQSKYEERIAGQLASITKEMSDNRDRIAANHSDLTRIDATLTGYMESSKQAGPGIADTREKMAELRAHVDEMRESMRHQRLARPESP
jgi:hypothetical protein